MYKGQKQSAFNCDHVKTAFLSCCLSLKEKVAVAPWVRWKNRNKYYNISLVPMKE